MLGSGTDLQDANISFITARQSLVNLGFDTPDGLDAKDSTRIAEELHFLGIPTAHLPALPTGTKTANLIPIRAPYPGVDCLVGRGGRRGGEYEHDTLYRG